MEDDSCSMPPPSKPPSNLKKKKGPIGLTINTQKTNAAFQNMDSKNKKPPFPFGLDQFNFDDYTRLTELGTGNGGVVTKVQNRFNGQIMAQKLIHLEVKSEIQRRILVELETLKKCQHDSIVGYFGAFHSKQNNEIVICMEHMDGRSLDVVLSHAGRIPEPIIGNISISVLNGLLYLHKVHKIMHRDVKPSNILVNSVGDIKLCDFGVSAQLINSIANSFVGTRSYMAPERLTGSAAYTIKSDIWSLGITFLELAIGFYPIPKPNQNDVLKVLQEFPALDVDNLAQFDRNSGCLGTGFGNIRPTRNIAIFELLEYIVSRPPPELYYFDPNEGYPQFFSIDFVKFVNSMLRQNMNERPDLMGLMEMSYR